jgi:hypothetical protein
VSGWKLKLFTGAWANASVFIDLQGVAAERKLTVWGDALHMTSYQAGHQVRTDLMAL